MRWSKGVKINNIPSKLLDISDLMKEAADKLPQIFEDSKGTTEFRKNIAREAHNLKPKNDKR